MNYRTEKFNKLLSDSPLAESALNWYDFTSDAEVLLIGDGFPKSYFEDRCARVISISPGDYDDYVSGQLFDYVICMGVIEKVDDPGKAVSSWKSLLKPGGTLLFSCDNRLGLKYFCGTPEKYTDIPFMGINGYYDGINLEEENKKQRDDLQINERLYSKAELTEILKNQGISDYKFYYPIPDARTPQLIFTDDTKDKCNALERLDDYDYYDNAMAGLEHRIFKDVVNEDALGFCANSFIVEITNGSSLSDITFAVVTTDRGKKHGMATTVRNNEKVYKRPLYPEGAENLKKLQAYTDELLSKNVPVVRGILKEDSKGLYMEMPYIEVKPLSLYLDEIVSNKREEFLGIFDFIYECIKKSFSDVNGGRVYLDLAPCNAFYTGGAEPVLFYDQEFVMENSSPEFAMFRTIKYYFAASKAARAEMELKELYKRYGISEKQIKEFEDKEAAFIKEVRNTDDHSWLKAAATPDYNRIYETNAAKRKEPKPYKVGYVPGVFDLFHTGHLRLIERCKARCEYLIVGVLTDELVKYYKGKAPIISCKDRMEIIAALSLVDEVIPVDFSNTDKLDAWEQLHYDCHFSGDDHVDHWNDILEKLREKGSNMEFFSYTQGISTTMIKEHIEGSGEEK